MDMKLNSTRVKKIPEKEKEVQLPKEELVKKLEIPEKPEIAKVEDTLEHKKFLEDESLKKSSVFVTGWKAIKKSSDEKKDNMPVESNTVISSETVKRLSQTPRLRKKSGLVRRSLIALLVCVVFLGLVYWGGVALEKTSVIIREKHQDLALSNLQFTALKDSKAPVHFEIMIVSDTESKDIVLTESQNLSQKAQGTVTFYNEYSTKPQNLLTKTFISDADGKSYQTDKAVTIPGYKIVDGKIVPGEVSVGITAFISGDQYNGDPTDFTINGFKDTDKFKKIYAKSTTPLSGGAQGLTYILGAADRGSLNATAGSAFKSRMIKKVNAEVPEGYILYPDATRFAYTIGGAQSQTPETKVNIDGTLSAIIFKKSDITNSIINRTLPDITNSERNEIEIPDISALSFKFTNSDQTITKDMESVPFALNGSVNAIWHPDVEKIKLSLVGIPKKDLTEFFKSDPGIAGADAKIFPPWNKYLPKDISRIHVTVK